MIAQNVAKLTVQSIFHASKKMKNATLIQVVRHLDNMVVFPLESYGFTNYLHTNGVNCRYLGDMYKISSVFHVKQMLLCEAIARSVKVLLKQNLQHCSRRGKAESGIAEERGRSMESHFVDHQDALLLAKKNVIVDMFNLVLGFGPKSDQFWTGESSNAWIIYF